MRHHLPENATGHIAAFAGVVLLHGGLLLAHLQPVPPQALPQQQVISVSMVAPPAPQPQPPQVQAVAEPAPKTPPKKKGMRKAEEPKPIAEAPKPEPEPEQKEEVELVEQQPPAPAMDTSGQQADHATAQHAALTDPSPADYLQNPPPVYPRSALRRRIQGTVMVDVRVGVDGFPRMVRLEASSGYAMLDEAALEAVRKWQFTPARRGSEVVEAGVVVPVEFRIN